jgi:hypothetical protein
LPRSYLHHFGFFSLRKLFHAADLFVGHLLDFFERALLLVFADLLFLGQLLECVVAVAAANSLALLIFLKHRADTFQSRLKIGEVKNIIDCRLLIGILADKITHLDEVCTVDPHTGDQRIPYIDILVHGREIHSIAARKMIDDGGHSHLVASTIDFDGGVGP